MTGVRSHTLLFLKETYMRNCITARLFMARLRPRPGHAAPEWQSVLLAFTDGELSRWFAEILSDPNANQLASESAGWYDVRPMSPYEGFLAGLAYHQACWERLSKEMMEVLTCVDQNA
jgi:hypothetical protein